MRVRRRRRFVFAATGFAIMLSWVLYINKDSAHTFKGNIFYSEYNEPIWLATEQPVDLYAGELRRQLVTTTEEDTTIDISPVPACSLPKLDPFHSSLKPLIEELEPLDCGTLHSKFEKNILHVQGEDVVSVKYRIISRPELHDFGVKLSDPVEIKNVYKVEKSSNFYPIIPGGTGCIMHQRSKKCLHPLGGRDVPGDGERAVLHSDCCFTRISFKMTSSGALRHIPSGLCLHVNLANNSHLVTLEPKCTTKFQDSSGKLRVTKTRLCLQPKNKSPGNNDFLEAGRNCKDKFYFYKMKGSPFEGNATVNADFVRVDITRPAGKESITEVHMHTAPKPEVLQRKVHPAGIPVSIAMIMFDSTSAANFVRQMPITRKYLKTRPTIFLEGETIVGDGTTAQLCAMLTGIPEEEQPEARRNMFRAKAVDNWRWVFRDYKKHGYVTMYSEDSPGLGTFNLRLKGFRDPPTDHYGRPFWLEADKHAQKDYCSTNQPIHQVTMKYFLSLYRSYPNNPKFAFLLFSDLSHGNMNALKYADKDLTDLLKTMDRESHLDDSIAFIFGDHGARFGEMRKSLQGKLEERLPHMSITFPTWFPKKYPQLYKNVQQNAKLLTTPFDIYATLQHLLSYPIPPRNLRFGQSLFIPIDPQNRTCASAGVEEHWCPCMNLERIPADNPVVKQAVEHVVDYINKLLEGKKKTKRVCHRLYLREVKTAQIELPNTKVQRFKTSLANRKCDSCGVRLGQKDENNLIKDTDYQIQFLTSPNDGFYEASVRFKGGVPRIKGAISRVDTYGDQPWCIQNSYTHLMKFCYCK